jgi:hypothetical protein
MQCEVSKAAPDELEVVAPNLPLVADGDRPSPRVLDGVCNRAERPGGVSCRKVWKLGPKIRSGD